MWPLNGESMENKQYEGLEILVLDDEPIVGKSLRMALGKLGFKVEVFVDPAVAMKRIDEKPFDIVITDVVMGDINSIQGSLSTSCRNHPEPR